MFTEHMTQPVPTPREVQVSERARCNRTGSETRKKTLFVGYRVDDAEKGDLAADAAARGMSLGEFVRSCVAFTRAAEAIDQAMREQR